MQITKVGFTGTYPSGAIWQKIMMEADLMPEDDPRKCLYELKKQVEEFFYESNGSAKKQAAIIESSEYATNPTEEQLQLPDMISQINSCTEVKVLESYKLIARTNPEWNKAYLAKMIELTNK